MGKPGAKWNAIFQNYLAFLSAHRGTVLALNDSAQVESEKKEFTYLVPGEKAPHPDLLKKFSTVQLNPWSYRAPGAYPGFEEKDSVSYIRNGEEIAAPASPPGFEIKLIKEKSEIYAFSDVQCRGFMGNAELYQEWAPFLHRANDSNLGSEGQFFYLGYLDGKPTAAALALDAEGVTGIYGIATLPDARKQGIAHCLLAKISADSYGRNQEALTLQVATDSYSEAYFAKLGFQREFTATILERAAK